MKKLLSFAIILALAFTITVPLSAAPQFTFGGVTAVNKNGFDAFAATKLPANNSKTDLGYGTFVADNKAGWYLSVTEPATKGTLEVAYKIGSDYYIVAFKIDGPGNYWVGDGSGKNGVNMVKIGEFKFAPQHPATFTMMDLSNIIDWFGINNTHPDWYSKYIFWDFNDSGEIDIYDIVYVAQRINGSYGYSGVQRAAIYGYTAYIGHTLEFTADRSLASPGDEFLLDTAFAQEVKANAAALRYEFDSKDFEYNGFAPADGVTVLDEIVTDGQVWLVLMKQDYNMTGLGRLMMRVEDNALITDSQKTFNLIVDYILMDDGPEKQNMMTSGTASIQIG